MFSLSWPQTAAPLSRRIAVLDGLRRRAPRAAWSLLRAVLPASSPSEPRCTGLAGRPLGDKDPPYEINYAEVIAGTAEIVTRLRSGTSSDSSESAGVVRADGIENCRRLPIDSNSCSQQLPSSVP